MEIVRSQDLKNKIANARSIEDNILSIKLALRKETMDIISAYAWLVGLDKETKLELWDLLYEFARMMPLIDGASYV